MQATRLFSHLERIIVELINEKISKKEILSTVKMLLLDKEVSTAMALHQNGFSRYKDVMYRLIKKQKYQRLVNLIKFKIFVKKLLHKD